MKDFSSKAREIFEANSMGWNCDGPLVKDVSTALLEAYREGLEDAAKKCDEGSVWYEEQEKSNDMAAAAKRCAINVRALKEGKKA